MLVLAQGIYDVCMLCDSGNWFLTPAYLALLYDHTCFCNLRMFLQSPCESPCYMKPARAVCIFTIYHLFFLLRIVFLRFVISTAKNTCYNIYKRTEDSLWRTRNGFYQYTGSIFIGRAVRRFWTICYRSIVISFAHRQAPVFTVHMPGTAGAQPECV